MTVANLRTAAGKDPGDKALQDLVGELSTRSDEFRRRWASHNVRSHGSGVKHFHHHIVGDLALAYESLDLRAEPGLTMVQRKQTSIPRDDQRFVSWAIAYSRILVMSCVPCGA